MSRCFPFPPPGYEKKARDDEAELLSKDKQKEKKHKKEKKDKKKEGKDKDKDRSKDKDRDKKERKEKHKDKKSKDKRKTDESKLEGPGECSNGGKHLDNNQQSVAIKNTKFVDINPRVVADEERGGRDQMAENHPSTTNRRDDEGGVDMLMDKYFDNRVQDKESIKGKEPEKKMERQRINGEGKILGNAMAASFSSAEQKRVGTSVRPMEKDAAMVKNFSSAEKKRVGAIVRPMEKEATIVTNFSSATSSSSAEQKRVGDAVQAMEKDAERKMEAKEKKKEPVVIEAPRKMEGEEKKKELVGNDVARKTEGKEKKKDSERKEKKKEKEERRKHRDGEKKSKEKKGSEKEKMKEKVKNETNKMIIEQVVPKVDRINTLNIKPIQIPTPKDSDTGNSRDDSLNLKKRKESDSNGFLHDNVVLPNKLPRPTITSPPLPFPMNGRKQDLSQPQPISPFAVAVQRGPNSIRFDNKVLKANGLIQAPPPPPTTTSTSSSLPPIKAKENGESSRKPHPDTKYLSQILSVPKMDDWSDFDDQEWLFSNEGKKKSSSAMEDDIPQVWDRAMQIDSADLCALPYVIPY